MKIGKHIVLCLVLAISAFVLSNCKKTEETSKLATIDVVRDTIVFAKDNTLEKEFTFSATRAWKITTEDAWLTVEPAAGAASDDVKVNVKAQKSTEDRLGSFSIILANKLKEKKIFVVQGDIKKVLPKGYDKNKTAIDNFVSLDYESFFGNVKVINVNNYGAIVNDGGEKNLFISTYNNNDLKTFLKDKNDKVIYISGSRDAKAKGNGFVTLSGITEYREVKDKTIEVKPEATKVQEFDKDKLNAIDANSPIKIKIEAKYVKKGKYYNLVVGTDKKDKFLSPINAKEYNLEEDKTYVLEGYVIGYRVKTKDIITFTITKADAKDAPLPVPPVQPEKPKTSVKIDDFVKNSKEGDTFVGIAKILVVADAGAVMNDGGDNNIFISFYAKKKAESQPWIDFAKQNINKVVRIEGKRKDYKGFLQIQNPNFSEASGETIPEKVAVAKVLDKGSIDSENGNIPVFVKVEGKYTKSTNNKGSVYKNLKVDDAKRTISLVEGVLPENLEEGKTYVVEGYYIGIGKSKDKEFYKILVSKATKKEENPSKPNQGSGSADKGDDKGGADKGNGSADKDNQGSGDAGKGKGNADKGKDKGNQGDNNGSAGNKDNPSGKNPDNGNQGNDNAGKGGNDNAGKGKDNGNQGNADKSNQGNGNQGSGDAGKGDGNGSAGNNDNPSGKNPDNGNQGNGSAGNGNQGDNKGDQSKDNGNGGAGSGDSPAQPESKEKKLEISFENKANKISAGENTYGSTTWTVTVTPALDKVRDDGNKGAKIGSGDNPPQQVLMETESINGEIQAVVINTCGGSKVNATLSVNVGNVAFKTGDIETASISKSYQSYNFSGNAKGKLTIKWDQKLKSSGKKRGTAINVKSITIKYTEK